MKEDKAAEFKLGAIVISYIEMFGEAIAITTEGTQLMIDTYFNDLSIEDIPQQYKFNWLGRKGYLFTVINHLYKSSRAKLLAEALPLLIDPKNGLINQPDKVPADFKRFNAVLLIK